jgi:acylphosphatase
LALPLGFRQSPAIGYGCAHANTSKVQEGVMAEERIAKKVRITGRVQGVYFRGWTKSEAERLRLGGWVRNEHDGSVAAVIAGTPEAVEEMLRLMHRGPLDARVDEVAVEDADTAEVGGGFALLR